GSVVRGKVFMAAETANRASLVLSGVGTTGQGHLDVERYEFASGGAALSAPETGWWWNDQTPELGVAYFIEIQGHRLCIVALLFDSGGGARWYVADGELESGALGLRSSFTGSLEEYSGGSMPGSAYRRASLSGAKGTITLNFTGRTAATLTF